jgi:hypothetical protein
MSISDWWTKKACHKTALLLWSPHIPMLPGITAGPAHHDSNAVGISQIEKLVWWKFSFQPHRIDTQLFMTKAKIKIN